MYVRESFAAAHDPGVHLLPAAPVRAVGRLERAGPGPLEPAQPGDHAGLLGRLRACCCAGSHSPRAAHTVIDPRRARPVGLPRAGARHGAGPLVRPAPDRAAQPARAPRPARLAPERVGHQGGPHLLQALARAHGPAGGDVGRLLRVAARPLRPGVQRRHRSRRRLLPARRGQPAHLVGAGRLRPPRPLHRRLHPPHPHGGGALAAAGRRHPAERHLGPLPRQPPAVVVRRRLRPAPARHAQTPG